MDRLRRSIPLPRIARYDDACRFADADGMELYRWATSVALAVFDDIGHVEVAMRSAMARELAAVYGLEWFENRDILDQDALDRIGEAVTRTRLYKLPANPDLRHGKLVASMTFGFWVKMVGRGGYAVIEGEEFRRIYDTAIWKEAVRRAFPNVGDTDRKRVEVVARHVNALRNRIAHHEHIVWGVPMAGEVTDDGKPLRLSLSSAHQAVLELAGFLDHDLAEWIRQNSRVQERIDECPIYPLGLLLVDQHT